MDPGDSPVPAWATSGSGDEYRPVAEPPEAKIIWAVDADEPTDTAMIAVDPGATGADTPVPAWADPYAGPRTRPRLTRSPWRPTRTSTSQTRSPAWPTDRAPLSRYQAVRSFRVPISTGSRIRSIRTASAEPVVRGWFNPVVPAPQPGPAETPSRPTAAQALAGWATPLPTDPPARGEEHRPRVDQPTALPTPGLPTPGLHTAGPASSGLPTPGLPRRLAQSGGLIPPTIPPTAQPAGAPATTVPPPAGYAPPPDADATAVLPRVPAVHVPGPPGPTPTPNRAATVSPMTPVSPAGRAEAGTPADDTAVIAKVRVPDTGGVTVPDAAPSGPAADDNGASGGAEASPRGVKVVPLRPVRTEKGYRSVYSDMTRTTPGAVVRTVVRTVGELCITLGMVVLLFAAWEVWGKTAEVNAHQKDLDSQLNQQWAAPAPAPSGPAPDALPAPNGNAIARLYVPRLNKNWIVVQGTTKEDIRFAPGHYPASAMPGQIGNFSVAGHRLPAIFWDLDQMRQGDDIVVETQSFWYVYKVSSIEIVRPTAVEVVAPVPDHPKEKPTQEMVTLTTCNPKYNNYQRLIVHGTLDPTETRTRAEGRPSAIGG